MPLNIKIFQLYYKPEQRAMLDPGFATIDNTVNPRPELREWYIWDREHEKIIASDLDYWGFVSWKFKDKTNLSSQQILDFILNNPPQNIFICARSVAIRRSAI